MTGSNGLMGSEPPLERWLAVQRARIAWQYLPASVRTGRILDIGCGRAAWFLDRIDAVEKEGLDQLCESREHITVRNGTAHRMRLQAFDVTQHDPLPFDEAWFDAVVALAVLEHIPRSSVLVLLREISRVLKPGGRCILTTPARGTETLLHGLAWLSFLDHDLVGQHHRHFTLGELRALCCEAGFPDEGIRQGRFEFGMNLWTVVSRAP